MTPGTVLVNGLVWPAVDAHCKCVVFRRVVDLERAYAVCRGFAVAVQAGGNCGVWPLALADRFQQVYTFEPEPLNYQCLSENCKGRTNVVVSNQALGYARTSVGIGYPEGRDNMGACAVTPDGTIPLVRIDDLQLDACDLIQLDIEGFEVEALKGARQTIAAYHPVLMVEDKGLSAPYGPSRGWSDTWGAELGYAVVDRVERDVILAWKG